MTAIGGKALRWSPPQKLSVFLSTIASDYRFFPIAFCRQMLGNRWPSNPNCQNFPINVAVETQGGKSVSIKDTRRICVTIAYQWGFASPTNRLLNEI
jgi:hypothetical protein